MTDKSLPQPRAFRIKGRTFTPYVAVWAGLASLSLIYLALLAAQPTFVAQVLGAGSYIAEADAEAQAAQIGETVSEVRALRDTIDQFRNELFEMRAQVSSQTDSARELATRLATLEAEPAEPQRVAEATGKSAQQAKKDAERTEKLAAAQKAKDAKAAKKKSAELETGSVASPAAGAITFGPPTVTPTPTAAAPVETGRLVGIQIATGPSVDSLRLSWTLLNERHGDTLRALEPRYTTDATGPDQSYDLVVGPLANADEARRLCHELALKATPCSVSRFTGDAL